MSSSLLAVVVAGGTGIGRAQALALSKIPGMTVIIAGRRKEPLEATQREIGLDKCHIVPDCDSGKIESWKRIVSLVEDLGGRLHFVGNTMGSPSPRGPFLGPYEAWAPEDIIAYNTSYISGIQLSNHFLVPFLIRGAEERGKPSIVVNLSSSNTILPRGLAGWSPMYHPSKCAMDAITRCAYGMYSGKQVLTFSINPAVYITDMALNGSATLGMTIEDFVNGFNPLPVGGDPADIGYLSAALVQGQTSLESGVSYVIFPVPKDLLTADGAESTEGSSILYSTALHGCDVDGLEQNLLRKAWAKIPKAFDCQGRPIPEATLEKVRQAIADQGLRQLSLPADA